MDSTLVTDSQAGPLSPDGFLLLRLSDETTLLPRLLERQCSGEHARGSNPAGIFRVNRTRCVWFVVFHRRPAPTRCTRQLRRAIPTPAHALPARGAASGSLAVGPDDRLADSCLRRAVAARGSCARRNT